MSRDPNAGITALMIRDLPQNKIEFNVKDFIKDCHNATVDDVENMQVGQPVWDSGKPTPPKVQPPPEGVSPPPQAQQEQTSRIQRGHTLAERTPHGRSVEEQDTAQRELSSQLSDWYNKAYELLNTMQTKEDVDGYLQHMTARSHLIFNSIAPDRTLVRALVADTLNRCRDRITEELFTWDDEMQPAANAAHGYVLRNIQLLVSRLEALSTVEAMQGVVLNEMQDVCGPGNEFTMRFCYPTEGPGTYTIVRNLTAHMMNLINGEAERIVEYGATPSHLGSILDLVTAFAKHVEETCHVTFDQSNFLETEIVEGEDDEDEWEDGPALDGVIGPDGEPYMPEGDDE
jgi:hypothetical protein